MVMVLQKKTPIETPTSRSRGTISRSSFSLLDPDANFTSRSKSFANNVLSRLKRRVSFAGRSNARSFHMNSKANLSIYRVEEESNESPSKD